MSSPVIATIPTTTPVIIDITTPQTTDTTTPPATIVKPPKQYNKTLLNPIHLNKKGKIISQEKIQGTALKMTQRLAKLNYRDTGFLSNATPEERNKIIALSMYYQIGRYDPSSKFVVNYRNKDVLQLYKKYTEKKMIKINAFIEIYNHIHDIEEHMTLEKEKVIIKIKIKIKIKHNLTKNKSSSNQSNYDNNCI